MATVKKKKETTTEEKKITNTKIQQYYCIQCGSVWKDNFYMSYNTKHANGNLPYCKQCISKYFEEYYFKNDCDIEVAIYLTCRMLDIPFSEIQYNNALNQLQKEKIKDKNFSDVGIIKMYISFLNNSFRYIPNAVVSFDDSDTSFDVLKKITSNTNIQEKIQEWKTEDKTKIEEELKELRRIYGDKYKDDELMWMRDEYAEWDRGFKIADTAMEKIVQDICKIRLKLRDIDALETKEIKSLQDIQASLIRQGGLTPRENKDKNETKFDQIGMKVKMLENSRPAEDENLKKKYKDMDNWEQFFKVYVRAPMKKSIGVGNEDDDVYEMEKEIEQYKVTEEELVNLGISDAIIEEKE